MNKNISIIGRWFRKQSEAMEYAKSENEKMERAGKKPRYEVVNSTGAYMVISSRQKEAIYELR